MASILKKQANIEEHVKRNHQEANFFILKGKKNYQERTTDDVCGLNGLFTTNDDNHISNGVLTTR